MDNFKIECQKDFKFKFVVDYEGLMTIIFIFLLIYVWKVYFLNTHPSSA